VALEQALMLLVEIALTILVWNATALSSLKLAFPKQA